MNHYNHYNHYYNYYSNHHHTHIDDRSLGTSGLHHLHFDRF